MDVIDESVRTQLLQLRLRVESLLSTETSATHMVVIDGSGRPVGKFLEITLEAHKLPFTYLNCRWLRDIHPHDIELLDCARDQLRREQPKLWQWLKDNTGQVILVDDQVNRGITLSCCMMFLKSFWPGLKVQAVVISRHSKENHMPWLHRYDLIGIELSPCSFLATERPTVVSQLFYAELCRHANLPA